MNHATMADRVGIGETELGAELGFDRVAMRGHREKLDPHDWWNGGPTNRKIFWTHKAADQLREMAGTPPEPEETFRAQVVRQSRNAFFADVGVDGICKPVRLIKRGSAPKLMKKTITVRRDGDGNLHQVA